MRPISRVLLATVVFFSGFAAPLAATAQSTLPPESPYDHLACYKVAEHKNFAARVLLDSAIADLEIPPLCKVMGRSLAFCAPVRKRVLRLNYHDDAAMQPYDMPGDHQREARICYRLKCPVEKFEGPLTVKDQFGRHTLHGFELKRLCTNARVIPDVSTTTTTTTTTTVPIHPCALVDCAPGHHCRPICDEPREAECVPFVPEDGICGGFVPPCRVEICEPGLECVAPPGLENIPDIPGICVRPNNGECSNDEDCPHGQVCELFDFIDGGGQEHRFCVPGCHDDDDCHSGEKCHEVVCVTTPCPGQCLPSLEPECAVDDDCPEGQVCEPGAPFDPRPMVCAPGCHTDDQCKPGQQCVEVACFTTPCPGQCVGDPGECGQCVADNDCSDGRRCTAPEECLLSCDCPECDVCAGHCEPSNCGDCYSDNDCPADLYCNVHDACLVACDCPLCAVCAGACVARPIDEPQQR